jgi:hypothetical protein
MRAAAKELDVMIAEWGASEDDLMREYKEIRHQLREEAALEVVGMQRKALVRASGTWT